MTFAVFAVVGNPSRTCPAAPSSDPQRWYMASSSFRCKYCFMLLNLRRNVSRLPRLIFLSFISLGSLARDDLGQPGEIIVGFWEHHLIFVRLPGFTYISAIQTLQTMTQLSLRTCSIASAAFFFLAKLIALVSRHICYSITVISRVTTTVNKVPIVLLQQSDVVVACV